MTRIRSDKGSFVQSPKLAFDAEEGAPPPTVGVISFVEIYDDLSNVVVVMVPGCDQGFAQPYTPGGYGQTQFQWDVGAAPDSATMISGTYVGETSGTIYSPSDDPEMVFNCTPGFNVSWYKAGAPEVLTEGDAYRRIVATTKFGAGNHFTEAFTNQGRFFVPHQPAGFVLGERFSFTP